MKNLELYSEQSLIDEREKLTEDLNEYLRMLKVTKSRLYCMVIEHYIRTTKSAIHRIDAELAYRRSHRGTI